MNDEDYDVLAAQEPEVEVEMFGEEGPQPELESVRYADKPIDMSILPKHRVHRQRLSLSLALLAQVCKDVMPLSASLPRLLSGQLTMDLGSHALHRSGVCSDSL